MGRKRRYTDEELILAVSDSISISSVLREIGLSLSGGNHRSIKSLIKEMNLDISHFTGQAHMKGHRNKWSLAAKPLEEILIKGSRLQNSNLRTRLIKEGILENKCFCCKMLPIWDNKPLTLQLDHIDGDYTNNELSNLRLLCPNCHSQTPTWSGKNRKIGLKKDILCSVCDKIITKKSKSGMCSPCFNKSRASIPDN